MLAVLPSRVAVLRGIAHITVRGQQNQHAARPHQATGDTYYIRVETIEKIDAVSTADVRAMGARLAGQAGTALAVYGPVETAPSLASLRERLAA